jgi:hypothetical protein
MDIIGRWRTAATCVLAAGAALALSACIVSPGKFAATLDLRRDGAFTFTYDGEIYLLALSQLASMARDAEIGAETFEPQACHDEEDWENWEERPCTEAELAEQRETWEQQVESRRASANSDAEMMSALLGGIDPSSPEAAEELAERLRRQEGWQRVDHKGDGRFEVQFSLTSRIGHDFSFPTFERFPMSNAFVVANRRKANTVRIDAPGFAAQGGGNPLQSMMGGMAQRASFETGSGAPDLPEMQGTFRIVTDGRILSNNTDEGPRAGTGGQVLEWQINRRTQAAPMALVELGG